MDEAEDGLGQRGDLVVAEIEDGQMRKTQWKIKWDLFYEVEGEVEAGMEADFVQERGRDLIENIRVVAQSPPQKVLVVELLAEFGSPDVGLGQLTVGQRCGATAAHHYQLSDISENNNTPLSKHILMVGSMHDFDIFHNN